MFRACSELRRALKVSWLAMVSTGPPAVKLQLLRCHSCSRWNYRQAPRCPGCWSELQQLEAVSGGGRIFSVTRVLRQGTSVLAGLVELDEQRSPRVFAQFDVPNATNLAALLDARVCFDS